MYFCAAGISSSSFLNDAMLKASSRIGVSAITVALRGLWPISAISPTIDPEPIVGDVLAAGEDAGLALEHEEALDADVALVDEDRPRAPHRPARRGRRRAPARASCMLANRAIWRRSSTVAWIASFFDGMLRSPGVRGSAGQPTPALDRPSRRLTAARRWGRRAGRVHGDAVASIDRGRRRLEPPAVDDQGQPPAEGGRAAAAVAAVGSPWRLALVAAIGPTRSATARTSVVVGHPQPTVLGRLAEVELDARLAGAARA